MKTRITAILAAIVLIMSTVMLTVPAQATDNGREVTPVVQAKDITWGKAVPLEKVLAKKAWGTSVTHAADDSGYAGDIHVLCNDGRHWFLKPGQGTFLSTGTNCSYSGVDRIIVAYNQTVYCKNAVPPYENTYFYTGGNPVPSNRTYKCYAQRPL